MIVCVLAFNDECFKASNFKSPRRQDECIPSVMDTAPIDFSFWDIIVMKLFCANFAKFADFVEAQQGALQIKGYVLQGCLLMSHCMNRVQDSEEMKGSY